MCLGNKGFIEGLSKMLYNKEQVFFIGRGPDAGVSYEGSLKLKEISYIHAEAYATGELKHGPIALVDDRFFEVFDVLDGPLFEKTLGGLQEVRARGGHTIVLTDSKKDIECDDIVRIKTDAKLTVPLLLNTLQQLFAYYVAVARGNDVDQPRNLAKSVTVE